LQKLTHQMSQSGSVSGPYLIPGAPAAALEEAAAWVAEYNATKGPSDPPAKISEVLYPPFSRFFSETFTRTYDNLLFEKDVKCFIVTRSSVAVVNCSQRLEEVIKEKYKYANTVTKSVITLPVITGTGYVTVVYLEPDGTERPVDGGLYQALFASGSRQIESLSVELANQNNYQSDTATWLALLRSYGYGKLVNRPNGQDPAWGWTPVIFSFLKNYNGEFHGNWEQPQAYDYSYVSQRYFPDDKPRFMLESNYTLGQDKAIIYHYFLAPPSGNFKAPVAFQAPPIAPRKISGPPQRRNVQVTQDQGDQSGPSPWLNGQEVPVVTWDWGRPLACILQLQSLGFTAEDLMLTPEETAALAAADPAEVGFKF
jgi:hypothetical protein